MKQIYTASDPQVSIDLTRNFAGNDYLHWLALGGVDVPKEEFCASSKATAWDPASAAVGVLSGVGFLWLACSSRATMPDQTNDCVLRVRPCI